MGVTEIERAAAALLDAAGDPAAAFLALAGAVEDQRERERPTPNYLQAVADALETLGEPTGAVGVAQLLNITRHAGRIRLQRAARRGLIKRESPGIYRAWREGEPREARRCPCEFHPPECPGNTPECVSTEEAAPAPLDE